MTLVNNSETLLELRRAAQIQQGKDETPMVLGDRIIPVIDINPKNTRRSNFVAIRTTTGTLVSAIVGRRFFLTTASLSGSKTVTDSGSSMSITITTPDGTATTPISLTGVTLTAERDTSNLNFVPALECMENTVVTGTVSGTWSAARICITGYWVDNPNG